MRYFIFASALVFRVVEIYLPVVKLGSDLRLRAAYKYAFPLTDTDSPCLCRDSNQAVLSEEDS